MRGDYTYQEIADALGVTFSAVKSRFYRHDKRKRLEGQKERKPPFIEQGDIYIVYTQSGTVEIDKETLRKLKQLYCEQKLTINQVCRELDMPRPDFWAVKTAFGITKDDIPYLDEDLETRTIEELVDESLERKKRQYFIRLQQQEIEKSLAELKEYRRKDYFADKIIQSIQGELSGLAQPPKTPPTPVRKRNCTVVINKSDWHKGKLIADNIVTDNRYNHRVYEKRKRQFIQEAISYIDENQPERVILIDYGDGPDDPNAQTYHGQVLNQDSTGNEQIVGYVEDTRDIIHALYQVSPELKVISIPGNHSNGFINWDLLAYQMVEILFKDYDIDFDCSDKPSKVVHIYDSSIVATHGNHIRKGKTTAELDTMSLFRMYGLNTKKSYLVQGHLHHYEGTAYRRILLPSMCGADDLAENIMNTTSRPAQLLFLFTEEGLKEERYIYFD